MERTCIFSGYVKSGWENRSEAELCDSACSFSLAGSPVSKDLIKKRVSAPASGASHLLKMSYSDVHIDSQVTHRILASSSLGSRQAPLRAISAPCNHRPSLICSQSSKVDFIRLL